MTEMAFSLQGQGWPQVGALLLAFLLCGLVGLERQSRGKRAGLRTQAIVGITSALFLLVSKFGFMNVLGAHVVLDPSRVAAQVVSGIGFLGAGLILTRRGTVVGLTTAVSVWEATAIGMAAGAGLWVLALVVTALHSVIVYGLNPLINRLPGGRDGLLRIEIVYEDGRGLLRMVLRAITAQGWAVSRAEPHDTGNGAVSLVLVVEGPVDKGRLVESLTGIGGVRSVQVIPGDSLE